jgi:SAM-dependent methyltransferase
MEMDRRYLAIVEHYEACLAKHGDTHLGVDWPKKEDVAKRYQVMLEVIRTGPDTPVSLLDVGCGAAHLYEYISRAGYPLLKYHGLDISEKFVALCRAKYPRLTYYCLDILADETSLPEFDYLILNGVFTEKVSLSFEEMLDYFKAFLRRVFRHTRVGLAFNVMSKHVDWERADLFHLPHDTLAAFLTKELTRNYVIRNDYGLYEYTTYVYR